MDKNSIFSKKTQSESGLKSKILVGVMILFSLFIISFANAELITFDNLKSYDVLKQEVTITNTFGIGGDIAKIKLNTPLKVIVPRGYQKIAEFEVTNYKDYVNAFEEIKFYNYKEYLTSKAKAVSLNRQYDYKFKGYETITINDYKTECSDFLEKNGTKTNLCYETISGTHEEQKEVWLPLEKLDFLSGEVVTIGIFTEVQKGDNVEWIPEFYGVKINEWASWEESLNVGLVSYYKLDETSGTTTYDSVGLHNGTLRGNVIMNTPGKIGGSYNFSQSRVDGVANINSGNFTINLWVNHNGTFPSGAIVGFYSMGKESDSSTSYAYIGRIGNAGYGIAKQAIFIMAENSKTTQYIAKSPFALPDNKWVMLTAVYNTSSVNLYVNGSLVNSAKYSGGAFSNINSGYISGKQGDASQNATGSNIDEIGIWSRALSYDEIQNLWNSGAGNTYLSSTDPTITLNSPEDYFNSSISAITFNFTGYVHREGEQIDSISLYIDGVLSETNTTNMANGTNYIITKAISSGYHNWSVNIISTEALTTSSAVRFFNITIYSPDVTLTSPIAYYNTSNPTINFEAEATDDFTITNVSLYLDGVINETNTSGVNGTYEFTKTLSEGEHYWSILAYDNDSNPTQSGDRYFTIDYTNPTITITNPLNTTYYTTYTATNNVTHTYNWTTSDLNLDSCWWSLDDGVTNNTVTCNNNYSFFYPFGQQTFIAWANDSSGNLGVSRVSATWDFMLYELSRFYNSSSVVSASENFILFLNKSSNILTQNATFKYNGISYPVATTTSGNLINFTTSINIPANASVNNSFNWTVGFTNSTGIFFYNTTSSYQTIANITIANCSTTAGSNFALNFSTYDATNMTSLNTTFEMNFYFYDYTGDGSIVGEFLYTDTSENHSNFLFCMNSSNRNITANAVVSYGAENYDERQYYITNGTISQTVQNISLYLTETDLTDIVTIKLQDQGYVGISGAYISIQEWNIGTNTYSTIGMCQTSSVGECVMDLELYTTFYRAVVYYEGSIVEITDTQKLSSTSWIITITLEEENPYDLFNNIATSLTFSNITNITTYTWVDTSGYSQRGCLVVKNYTTTGQEIIYNSCTESVSGSIDYLISGDGSYYVYGYIYLSEYGTYKILEYLEIQLGTLEINRVTSPYGKVISFFIIGTLGMIGVAAGSALLGSVLVIIGLILSWKIGFLNITVSFIWSMVVIALLIIVLQNRRQQ